MNATTTTRTQKALKSLAVALAALTYCGAVIYGDVMFISVMQAAFPAGILGDLALAGAVMTAVSAITLPIALHYWLSPGLQFIGGVAFWVADIIVLALNSILAFAIATGQPSPLQAWSDLSPATPLLAVLGWGLIFLLDPSHKLRHAQAELEADLIDIHADQLRDAARGNSVRATITTGAQDIAAQVAAALTGVRAGVPASPNGRAQFAATVPNATGRPAKASGPAHDSTTED